MSEAQNDSDFAARVIDLMGARHAKAAPRADAKDEIERLSHLNDLDLELEMADAAKRLNVSVPTVRKLVKEAHRRRRTAEAAAPHGEEPPPAAGEPPRWPRGFTMTEDGLLARPAEGAPPVWVCSPFEVLGEARNPEGEGWSKWIRWRDADGRAHEMPVEAALLHKANGANGDLEARLADRGLRVSADARTRGLLRQALAGVRSGTRATLVPRSGWAVLADGSRGYVFPDGAAAGGAGETLILHPLPESGRNHSGEAGVLEGW
jgi:putative DNA primase/helicase